MYRVTVQSELKLTPEETELNKYISELVFIDKKHSARQKQFLCKINLKDCTPEFLADLFSKSPNIMKFNYRQIEKNCILASIVFKKISPRVFPVAQDCGCILLRISTSGNVRKHILLVPDKSCFEKHLQDFQKNYKVIEVKWEEATSKELTAKQHELLKLALETGYFDFPKKIHIRELAKTIGVSTAALAETLNTAKKKILEKYFEGGN
jgi:predicted DNA binding protein